MKPLTRTEARHAAYHIASSMLEGELPHIDFPDCGWELKDDQEKIREQIKWLIRSLQDRSDAKPRKG